MLRKQPVEQDLVAVVQGGQVDVFTECIRQALVLNVGALDLISEGTDIRRKQTREAQSFSFFRRKGGPLVQHWRIEHGQAASLSLTARVPVPPGLGQRRQ